MLNFWSFCITATAGTKLDTPFFFFDHFQKKTLFYKRVFVFLQPKPFFIFLHNLKLLNHLFRHCSIFTTAVKNFDWVLDPILLYILPNQLTIIGFFQFEKTTYLCPYKLEK